VIDDVMILNFRHLLLDRIALHGQEVLSDQSGGSQAEVVSNHGLALVLSGTIVRAHHDHIISRRPESEDIWHRKQRTRYPSARIFVA
jgi:hypothetical protein